MHGGHVVREGMCPAACSDHWPKRNPNLATLSDVPKPHISKLIR